MIIEVENIKCGGCVNSIRQKLIAIDGVKDVAVDIEKGEVDVSTDGAHESLMAALVKQLESMGYPQRGSVSGLSSVKAKATSYVSCAIGKISD